MKMAKKVIISILLIALLYALLVFKNHNQNKMAPQSKIQLSSTAFLNNQTIPMSYSCNGENINPPLLISNVPAGTKSLAIIVDDPDAITGDWVHWLIWNIPPSITKINSGSIPAGSVQGPNGFSNNRYDGPCPPSGTHRYFFRLYALDITLGTDRNIRKNDLLNAMSGHILDQATFIGLYSK